MNHPMRRGDRQLSEDEARQILARGEYGVLSTVGRDGFPYGVPLSYAYDGRNLYFHCAAGTGHKLENLDFNQKVCFTVVGETQVLPAQFSTKYESVIVFGTVAPAEDKLAAIEQICKKYSADFLDQGKKYAAASETKFAVYALRIRKISGKARRA